VKCHLAENAAAGVVCVLLKWHIKGSPKGGGGLYVYDTVSRLHDSRFGDGNVRDVEQYIEYGPVGQALAADQRVVLLIDEVDKADIEFPNDLLLELDAMRFRIDETNREVAAKQRPIVLITSNNEKELPDAFLRRCVFHFIEFPDKTQLADIVRVHFPSLEDDVIGNAIEVFYGIRNTPRLRKKPSTSELIDWLAALQKSGMSPKKLAAGIPFLGTLLKTEQDHELFSKRAKA